MLLLAQLEHSEHPKVWEKKLIVLCATLEDTVPRRVSHGQMDSVMQATTVFLELTQPHQPMVWQETLVLQEATAFKDPRNRLAVLKELTTNTQALNQQMTVKIVHLASTVQELTTHHGLVIAMLVIIALGNHPSLISMWLQKATTLSLVQVLRFPAL